MRLIDSHAHFWRIGRNGQSWPGPDLPEIYRDFHTDDLLAAASACGLQGVIAVQSQPDDLDTEWLLELAQSSDLIVAVVGWVDLRAPDAPDRLEGLARHPKFRGVRPMLQNLAEDDWINRTDITPAIAALEALDLAFDALIKPRHLPSLRRFADAHPRLRIVIDHAAKPAIADDRREPWASDLREVSKRPNVYCKLSGLSSELAAQQPMTALAGFIDDVLGSFPSDRLMWGSDWPVVNTRSDYHDWLTICRQALSDKPLHVQSAIFRQTAETFYKISPQP
jgi:L-fuconolactonase